jgi:hypothetical protein
MTDKIQISFKGIALDSGLKGVNSDSTATPRGGLITVQAKCVVCVQTISSFHMKPMLVRTIRKLH